VSKLLIQHEDLDLRLNQIDDLYSNTDVVLEGLEKQVDLLFEHCMGAGTGTGMGMGMGSAVDDGDMEREHYYNIAMEVDGRLNRVDDEVCDLEKMLEGLMHGDSGSLVVTGAAGGDNVGGGEGSDVAEIVKVMNRQNEMLNGLEVCCEKMESEIHLVSRVVLERQ